MATGKLLGTDTTGAENSPAGYVQATQHTCIATGIVSEIRLHCLVSSNVRAAIFSDNGSDKANALLAESDSVAITAGDWRTVTLTSSVNVVAGVKYWLALQCQTAGGVSYRFATWNRGYKAQAYGAFPASGLDWTYDAAVDYGIQGYGVLVITPAGLSQPIAYGTPTVEVAAGLIIYPPGLQVVIAYGMPALRYPQTISPDGLSVPIAYGTPSIVVVGEGIIYVPGHQQAIAYGTPTILKYVWHVILDGQYSTDTPRTNRAYVIGRDQYGNPVYGTAVDSTELGLVGERLDFQQELAIPTDAKAADVAGAILAKMRLSGKRGVILIPPNCGQELFDTVQITDSQGNQSAVKFRVVGIRFEYNPKQARYQHRLILGAP